MSAVRAMTGAQWPAAAWGTRMTAVAQAPPPPAAVSRAGRLRRAAAAVRGARRAARSTCRGSTTRSCRSRGSSRYSREIEVPAHRGRIVDRAGEPLAISTPVKSIWAFPGEVELTPGELRSLASVLETTPKAIARKLADGGDFVFLARGIPPEVADRVAALKLKGIHDQTEVSPLLSGRRDDEPHPRLHRRPRRRPGRHRAHAAGVAGRQAGQPARDHQPPRRRRRGCRGDSRAAGRPRSGARDRRPAAVPGVPRAEGGGRGDIARRPAAS